VAAFNFGIPGTGPCAGLLYLRQLLRDGPRPNLLLLEVLPPLLAEQKVPRDLDEAHVPTPFLQWADLPVLARCGAGRRHLRRRWCRYAAWSWYYRRLDILEEMAPLLLHAARPTNLGLDASGWERNPAEGRPAESRGRALEGTRAEYEPLVHDFRVGAGPRAALREALALCRAEGVPAALVLMPEGAAFRSWYGPGAWPQVRGLLEGLGREFGARVIDARCWMPEDAFSDSHHLLPAPAAAFTARLGREAVAPLLRKFAADRRLARRDGP
jgi:hypothetical protein